MAPAPAQPLPPSTLASLLSTSRPPAAPPLETLETPPPETPPLQTAPAARPPSFHELAMRPDTPSPPLTRPPPAPPLPKSLCLPKFALSPLCGRPRAVKPLQAGAPARNTKSSRPPCFGFPAILRPEPIKCTPPAAHSCAGKSNPIRLKPDPPRPSSRQDFRFRNPPSAGNSFRMRPFFRRMVLKNQPDHGRKR